MHGPTLPFVPTKTYDRISVDLREKRKNLFFPLSISLLALTLCRSSFQKRLSPPFLTFLISFSFLLFLFLFFFFSLFSFFFYFLVLYFPLFPPFDTRLNVSHSHKCTTCHAMCHSTSYSSKNVKFRLSQNPTKFDEVTRFCEMNSTMKSVSSSKI